MWRCTGPILKITPVPKTHSPIERRQTVTIQSQQPARRTYLYLRHSHPLRQRNTSARAFHFCWKSRSHIRADLKLCVATSHFCHPDWQQVIAEFWRAWRTPLLRTHVAWCRCIAHSWGKNKSYSCMLVSLTMVRKIFFLGKFSQVELSLDSGVFHCLVFLSRVDNIPHQWLNTEPEIMNYTVCLFFSSFVKVAWNSWENSYLCSFVI